MNIYKVFLLTVLISCTVNVLADKKAIVGGVFSSQKDANRHCPRVCQASEDRTWDGQWWSTNGLSYCECVN